MTRIIVFINNSRDLVCGFTSIEQLEAWLIQEKYSFAKQVISQKLSGLTVNLNKRAIDIYDITYCSEPKLVGYIKAIDILYYDKDGKLSRPHFTCENYDLNK